MPIKASQILDYDLQILIWFLVISLLLYQNKDLRFNLVSTNKVQADEFGASQVWIIIALMAKL